MCRREVKGPRSDQGDHLYDCSVSHKMAGSTSVGRASQIGIPGAPPVADRIDDIRAVMDEAGSKRATLFGVSEAAAPTGRGSAIP